MTSRLPITLALLLAALPGGPLLRAQAAQTDLGQPDDAPAAIQPPTPPPSQPPPPMPSQPPAAAPQAPPPGQWVYTQQYGWVWMPYGDRFASTPEGGGDPSMYVYGPAIGWCWVTAPWVWGWGPRPFFGVAGPWGFGWWGHGYGHWYGFRGGYRPWGRYGYRRGWGGYHPRAWHGYGRP